VVNIIFLSISFHVYGFLSCFLCFISLCISQSLKITDYCIIVWIFMKLGTDMYCVNVLTKRMNE